MNLRYALANFTTVLFWNALLSVIQKTALTALSFFLYAQLSPSLFCTWTMINSITFLFVLWTDMGLRKSIPRYGPSIRSIPELFFYILMLISLRILIVCISIPLFYYVLTTLLGSLPDTVIPFYLMSTACFLLVTESILSLVELLFHAYFMHKLFTTISGSCITITTMLSLYASMQDAQSFATIATILFLRIASSCMTILIASIIFYNYPPLQSTSSTSTIDFRQFFRHTFFMWGSTLLKSLSERNVIIPWIAFTVGHTTANTVKIANDAALLFYRTLLKTIGTSDTTLLAYAHMNNDQQAIRETYQKIRRTSIIFSLAASLAALLFACYLTMVFEHQIMRLFILFVSGYIVEFAMSPAERALEVEGQYAVIAGAFIPYSIIIGGVACSLLAHIVDQPFTTILMIQGSRIIFSFQLFSIYNLKRSLETAQQTGCID